MIGEFTFAKATVNAIGEWTLLSKLISVKNFKELLIKFEQPKAELCV